MKLENINLGFNCEIHESSSINNVTLGHNIRIAKRCSVFGSTKHPLQIGNDSTIAMNCTLNGYCCALTIGENVSIAQSVTIMTNSGPNASKPMQRIFPIIEGGVSIGDHSWIGASVIIMPGVSIGRYCVVAAGSFVNSSFADYSVVGGIPAKLLRKLTQEEIDKL